MKRKRYQVKPVEVGSCSVDYQLSGIVKCHRSDTHTQTSNKLDLGSTEKKLVEYFIDQNINTSKAISTDFSKVAVSHQKRRRRL